MLLGPKCGKSDEDVGGGGGGENLTYNKSMSTKSLTSSTQYQK